ncbi:MAG: hypothetical protein IT242_08770 [Bacteroidia bacterium]|nr:hypothetical protein [Bacteroidia bacterium]
MKKSIILLQSIAVLAFLSVSFSSCVKDEFDQPVTANVDPAITPTHTILQLQGMASGPVPVEITTDVIVSGIIIADDASGNFYKEIIFQDSTAGLSISVDVSNFNSDYPIGRKIFVNCKGLFIADDGDGNFQLGIKDNLTIGRIPASLITRYITKGSWGHQVNPASYNLVTIGSAPSNTLIRLSDVEFAAADAGITYADGVNLISKNRTIEDCFNNTIKLYSSGYAKFANTLTPSGKGTIVAVNKFYNNSSELIIRDPADVIMNDNRCDGSSGQLTLMPLDSVRMLFTGTATNGPLGRKIRGTVTSDYINGNTDPKNMFIEDGTAGIVVRFTSAHSFAAGAVVEVNIGGQEISEYNGLLQLNNVPNVNAVQTGTGTVTPRTATIAQVIANFQAWESTLVKITGVTITGSGTYSGSNTVTDATGNMTLFTRSQATFAATAYPAGAVSVTGLLTEYSPSTFTPQISIRNTTDVQ